MNLHGSLDRREPHAAHQRVRHRTQQRGASPALGDPAAIRHRTVRSCGHGLCCTPTGQRQDRRALGHGGSAPPDPFAPQHQLGGPAHQIPHLHGATGVGSGHQRQTPGSPPGRSVRCWRHTSPIASRRERKAAPSAPSPIDPSIQHPSARLSAPGKAEVLFTPGQWSRYGGNNRRRFLCGRASQPRRSHPPHHTRFEYSPLRTRCCVAHSVFTRFRALPLSSKAVGVPSGLHRHQCRVNRAGFQGATESGPDVGCRRDGGGAAAPRSAPGCPHSPCVRRAASQNWSCRSVNRPSARA